MESIQPIQEEPGEGVGNTKTTPSLKSQRYRWVFTLNNYTIQEIDDILLFLKEEAKKYIFQEELGENETPHLQGCFWLRKKLYLKDLKGLMSSRAHFEGMNGTDEQNISYCSKMESRNGNCWSFGINNKKNEYFKRITELTLKPWQDSLIEILNCLPSDRKIYWIKSEPGCGKTTFCKYKILKEKWIYMKKARYSDIMNYISKTDTEDAGGIFIDLTLENENNISYSALEAIKDGMIFNSKYETTFKMIHPLHLVVFSNTYPDTSKLGKDR